MMFLFKVAAAVAAEPNNTPQHTARLAYAQRVFRGDERPQLVAAHVIVAKASIIAAIDAQPAALGSNVTEADIEASLTSIWTARALAYAAAPTPAILAMVAPPAADPA
jgi:hypothetical protein